jgi:hypothetical protein
MGMLIPGRAVLRAGIAVSLLCVAAALMVANAAHAARRGASHAARHGASHAATPALDAQAIDNAQFSAPSGKGRARAPSAATIIKEEILLDRADFSPGEIDGKAGSNDRKALADGVRNSTGRRERPFQQDDSAVV